ncbi:hypothetical protein [Breoghania sp.]|nr:hypothetical protein [Breoghania sp.]MDJ0929808.1 hypothetical protein [Breoghania sp.]
MLSVNADGVGSDWTPVVEFSDISVGETIRVVIDDEGIQADVSVAVA